MKTPIVDFVKAYAQSDVSRLHMPGHKGVNFLGFEKLDITEIGGADELYCPNGIIKESEDNAAELFGTGRTLYSAGGASQCIKAMVLLALKRKSLDERGYILAGRNAHKAFIHACALLDVEVKWLYPKNSASICCCDITAQDVALAIAEEAEKPLAVFVTSPDYLGNILDIASVSNVCKENNVPLMVDNAHGAYLKLLGRHPMDLGADICCDSGHKTLPAITGGAYLHINKNADKLYFDEADEAMAIFGSSSPSYLILQSLDYCNRLITNGLKQGLDFTIYNLDNLKRDLRNLGCNILESEPLKLVFNANGNGDKIGEILRDNQIEFEYRDRDNVVLMFSPYNKNIDFEKVLKAFTLNKFPKSLKSNLPKMVKGKQILTIKQAVLSKSLEIPVKEAVGKVCAAPAVSCPPAIPIVISGEEISKEHLKLFEYYNISTIKVVI